MNGTEEFKGKIIECKEQSKRIGLKHPSPLCPTSGMHSLGLHVFFSKQMGLSIDVLTIQHDLPSPGEISVFCFSPWVTRLRLNYNPIHHKQDSYQKNPTNQASTPIQQSNLAFSPKPYQKSKQRSFPTYLEIRVYHSLTGQLNPTYGRFTN